MWQVDRSRSPGTCFFAPLMVHYPLPNINKINPKPKIRINWEILPKPRRIHKTGLAKHPCS